MDRTSSPVDLDDLWKRLRTHGDEHARHELVEHYVGLVRYVAGRLAVELPHHLEFPDLYGAGLVGLIQAIDHFDPARGNKFETYAVPRIRGAILDDLRAQDWFPRSLRRKARQLETAFSGLEARLGRPPNDDEVAGELGMTTEELDRVMAQISIATMVSLESELHPGPGGSGSRIADTLVDTSVQQPEDVVAQRELSEAIALSLDELTDKERLVLTLYYYEELTLREIGEILGVTESRVCQIHTKAVFRLRGKMERRLSGMPLRQLGAEVAEALREKIGV